MRKAKVDHAGVLEAATRAYFLPEGAVTDLKVGLVGGLMNGDAQVQSKLAIEVGAAHECCNRRFLGRAHRALVAARLAAARSLSNACVRRKWRR